MGGMYQELNHLNKPIRKRVRFTDYDSGITCSLTSYNTQELLAYSRLTFSVAYTVLGFTRHG